jgi:signal transduction histidine kinase
MTIVVLVFVAATAYTQFLLSTDVDAISIAGNGAPSVAYMADARAALRLLARDAARASSAETPASASAARQAFAEHRRAIDAALTEYAKTPDYPGERALYQIVLQDLQLLDTRMAAHTNVDKEIDDLDASMHALSELNRRYMVSAEQKVTRGARRRNIFAFLLDGVGILVAIFATILAARTVERYIATLRRRARELEHLAIQIGHDIANPLAPIQVVMLGDNGGDAAHHEKALERGRRSLARIEGTIERLSTFAQAGMPPSSPLPRTPLQPVLHTAAHAAGLEVTVDPGWQVRCPESALREICTDLIGATTPGAGDVEVSATARGVRVTISCPPDGDGDGAGDPFDPRLHTPGAEHPGIDLRLATVRRYVEACGGRVGWRRKRREREELWIELPRG